MNTARKMKVQMASSSLLVIVSLVQAAGPLDTWAPRWVGATWLRGVAYGGGVFVAAGDVPHTSPDGVCWTPRPLEPYPENGLSDVAYGNGRFVAVEPSPWRRPGAAYVSTDGIAWRRSADLPGNNSLPVIGRIAFGGGLFLGVGQEANPAPSSGFHWLVMTSVDGVTWSRHSGPTNNSESYYLDAAAYGNGLYVVGGRIGLPTQQALLLTSTDTMTWKQVTNFPLVGIEAITYGNGIFVAVGSGIATSADGAQWTQRSSGDEGRLSAVAFGGGRFVAAGDLLVSSADAITWREHATSVPSFSGVAYGNGSFVAVGNFATALPRAVAVQSEGRPQLCLESGGFDPFDNRFWIRVAAEQGRTYWLQSSSMLPANSWTNVSSITIPASGYPNPFTMSDPNPLALQRFYRVVSP